MQCCDLCMTYHADMTSIDVGGDGNDDDIRYICDDCLNLLMPKEVIYGTKSNSKTANAATVSNV